MFESTYDRSFHCKIEVELISQGLIALEFDKGGSVIKLQIHHFLCNCPPFFFALSTCPSCPPFFLVLCTSPPFFFVLSKTCPSCPHFSLSSVHVLTFQCSKYLSSIFQCPQYMSSIPMF